jgi:hypothetical protein
MSDRRLQDLIRFYSIMNRLEKTIGGARALADCRGCMKWPARGVYFFREAGENRSDTGEGPRVVRAGTCAESRRKHDALGTPVDAPGPVAQRWRQSPGSIFRLIVGTALIARDGHKFPTWGEGPSAAKDIKAGEIELERAVSAVIRTMPFVWLSVDDEPGPASMRGNIERNAIALLSNFDKPPLDPRMTGWRRSSTG